MRNENANNDEIRMDHNDDDDEDERFSAVPYQTSFSRLKTATAATTTTAPRRRRAAYGTSSTLEDLGSNKNNDVVGTTKKDVVDFDLDSLIDVNNDEGSAGGGGMFSDSDEDNEEDDDATVPLAANVDDDNDTDDDSDSPVNHGIDKDEGEEEEEVVVGCRRRRGDGHAKKSSLNNISGLTESTEPKSDDDSDNEDNNDKQEVQAEEDENLRDDVSSQHSFTPTRHLLGSSPRSSSSSSSSLDDEHKDIDNDDNEDDEEVSQEHTNTADERFSQFTQEEGPLMTNKMEEETPSSSIESMKSTTNTSTNNEEDDDEVLMELVDELYLAACKTNDVDSMTVGDVHRAIATRRKLDNGLDKRCKKLVKQRLTDLVTGTVELEKKKMKSSKKKKEVKDDVTRDSIDEAIDDEEEEIEDDDEYEDDGGDKNNGSSDEEDNNKSHRKIKKDKSGKKTKSSTNKRRKSMADHLRDRHDKVRARQVEEARIRREELGHLADDNEKKMIIVKGQVDRGEEKKNDEEKEDNHKGPKISEEDQERARAIAERFDTNREELRVRRIEDRVGLIDRLRTRRLEIIASSGDGGIVVVEDNVKKMSVMDVKMKKEDEDDVGVTPRLTSTIVKRENDESIIDEVTKNCATVDLDSDDDDEEDSDGDNDDDLEIIASKECNKATSSNTTRKPSPVDLLFVSSKTEGGFNRKIPQKTASSRRVANPRMLLQNSLRVKVRSTGNQWLARELGYKGEADHIRDCKEVEEKKRKQILLIEKAKAVNEKAQALLLGRGFDDDNDAYISGVISSSVDAGLVRDIIGAELNVKEEYDNAEDEEIAVARELEQLETGPDYNSEEQDIGDEEEDVDDDNDVAVEESDESRNEYVRETRWLKDDKISGIDDTEPDENTVQSIMSSPATIVSPSRSTQDVTNENKRETLTETVETTEYLTSDPFVAGNDDGNAIKDKLPMEDSLDSKVTYAASNDVLQVDLQDGVTDTRSSIEGTTNSSNNDTVITTKKSKNSAWQAILAKEKAALAKEKKRQRKNGGLVEGEAEEEEEEEGIVGLEDFGFSVSKKKGDDDDADDEVDDDDLDNVVDDVSDGEGDEEAGEVARKRLEQAEEKERHKEIIRRMREGYDGRRGGIASGAGGARGMHRFDQLVAADNRDDAKRLGLLNDDELNSDDENDGDGKDKTTVDEEEDEAALLDKMLKERFLNREEEVMDEEFTDDEESEDEVDGTEQQDGDDNDEREQERLAKHFAKRARRNRILEEYAGDSQFSRSRLMDEDVTMQQDLKTIKTSFCRKRSTSNLDSKENNGSSKKYRSISANDKSADGASKTTTSNSLSVALLASRNSAVSHKRKTTFLSGRSFSRSLSSSSSSSSSKSVSLNHVVFMAGGDGSQTANSQLHSTSSGLLPRGLANKSGKVTKNNVPGGSLWSKVCSKNFRT